MMVKMLSYDKFPPIENFVKVLKHSPNAALIYAQLFHQKDEKNHLTISKEDVRNHFQVSSTVFKNVCLHLSEERHLFFTESNKYYFLDLIK